MYICVVNCCSGWLQFDPIGLNLLEPAGIFLVVESFGINLHHAEKLGTPAAAAFVSCTLMDV